MVWENVNVNPSVSGFNLTGKTYINNAGADNQVAQIKCENLKLKIYL